MTRPATLPALSDTLAGAGRGHKPRLLDLFCCQGGATRGYQDAGFHVIGVDFEAQPRYSGDEFHCADALAFLWVHREWIRQEVALVHASPPCQRYSLAQRIQGREHPDLIGPTRALLQEIGVPYVIENVEDARGELVDPVTLCGAMFGMRTYRHRLFETSLPLPVPEHPAHIAQTVKMGRPLREGDWYHAVGNFSNVPYVRADMGVPWMSRNGIRESIPPAYAQHVGEAFLAHLRTEVPAWT